VRGPGDGRLDAVRAQGPGFGARRFATGGGGHSDYLSPGGVSLRDLALIALGRTAEVAG
jgi:hypothetical protein